MAEKKFVLSFIFIVSVLLSIWSFPGIFIYLFFISFYFTSGFDTVIGNIVRHYILKKDLRLHFRALFPNILTCLTFLRITFCDGTLTLTDPKAYRTFCLISQQQCCDRLDL